MWLVTTQIGLFCCATAELAVAVARLFHGEIVAGPN